MGRASGLLACARCIEPNRALLASVERASGAIKISVASEIS